MKLSFVIPAYNEEDLIGKCLDSILIQAANRPDDIEIIVVNNASTDRTREIAESFPRVIVVDESKKGITHARHAGFLASSGDLIAYIDADTMLTPDWIDKVLKAFLGNPNLVALSGPHIFYDLSRAFNFWVRLFYAVAFISYLLNRFVFRVGSMLQGGNFVVKRSALEKIGGYNSKFDFYGEESDIARRLHPLGNVKFIFNLPIYASGRRIAAEGKLITAWRYGVNYFWAIFFKKPFTKTHLDVRLKNKEKPI
ncbi:MAG: glycosyltransferase family A protein [Candidatus Azambacteria bacterium]|nr:glycosyltransferase family A protein [Candidatus Azambacteria bacterium]